MIERAGHVLVAQRPPHKLLPLKWEFPGGKVEAGEDPAAAIIREIREELGCEIRLLRALPPFIHDYKTVVIEMIPFICALADASRNFAMYVDSESAGAPDVAARSGRSGVTL